MAKIKIIFDTEEDTEISLVGSLHDLQASFTYCFYKMICIGFPMKLVEAAFKDAKEFYDENSDGKGLICGEAAIEKLAWKPKDRELVWSIDCDGDTYSTNFFETYKNDLAMLKCGWYFKTKAEAEANRERVLKEYAEVMGDE